MIQVSAHNHTKPLLSTLLVAEAINNTVHDVVDDRASKPGPGPGRAFEARLKPGPGRASLKPGPGPGLLVNLPICTISDENIKIMSAKQT